MTEPAPRVECRGVVRRLPSGGRVLTVLDGIDLRIDAGDFVAILGPSGSGKSTLLGLLAGLDRPTEGTVRIDGEPLENLDEDALALLRRRKIGFVFQSFQLLGNLTARENVLLPLELNRVPDAGARTDELLRRVGLGERGHHYPSQLSGGGRPPRAPPPPPAPPPRPPRGPPPPAPPAALDAATGAAALDLLAELREREGATLVLVTHDAEVAARARRRIHLRAGRVERDEAGA